MANRRLTDEEWESVKIDIEVHSMSRPTLSKKYGVGKTTITDKVIKEGWIKGGAKGIIDEKISHVNAVLNAKPTVSRQPTDKKRQPTDNRQAEMTTDRYNDAVNDMVVGSFSTMFLRKLEELDFINLAMDKTSELMKTAQTPSEVKDSVDTAIKTGQLAFAIPLFSSQVTTINNTAQAAVVQKPKTIEDFYGDE